MTEKQRGFVAECCKGIKPLEAYKNNYNTSNMKPQTIRNKASLLYKQFKDEIDGYRQEATDKADKALIADVQEVMTFYTRMMRGDVKTKVLRKVEAVDKATGKKIEKIKRMTKDATLRDRVEGAKGLERILVGHRIIIDKEQEIDLSDVNPEDLKKLAQELENEVGGDD